jgi:hypothetical protein
MTAFELYLKIGFNHILDERLYTDILAAEGYDHLLFVVALASVYKWQEYKRVLILVTAFTIGHSVTLILSTFDFVHVSMKMIEFLIPLTIVLTAIFNLVKRHGLVDKPALRIRYWAALLFGLIHGLGFSNYLKALLGNEESILIPLLGFNIGLELGQLVIVLFTLFIFYLVNKIAGLKRQSWVVIVSIFVLILIAPILWKSFLDL